MKNSLCKSLRPLTEELTLEEIYLTNIEMELEYSKLAMINTVLVIHNQVNRKNSGLGIYSMVRKKKK